MIPSFTLVPSAFFSQEKARQYLEEVVRLDEAEPLSFVEVPSCDAVLVYSGDKRPPVYDMLMSLFKIREYNKVLFNIADGFLYLVVAQGESLKLMNRFPAADFVTAEYFVFSSLKRLQMNPEITTIFSMMPLSQSQCVSLCSYFKNVEVLQ